MTKPMTKKTPHMNSSINVTPMVDVMLVLLIIFMVITPMLTPGRNTVELAKTQNAEEMKQASSPDALLIAIERNGKVFLGSEQIELKDLGVRVRERLEGQVEKKAFVKADARVHYGSVVAVVDEVRAGGVDQLGLLTEKVKVMAPI